MTTRAKTSSSSSSEPSVLPASPQARLLGHQKKDVDTRVVGVPSERAMGSTASSAVLLRWLEDLPRFAMLRDEDDHAGPARALELGGLVNDRRVIDAEDDQWVKWADIARLLRSTESPESGDAVDPVVTKNQGPTPRDSNSSESNSCARLLALVEHWRARAVVKDGPMTYVNHAFYDCADELAAALRRSKDVE